jgi:TatD DNase family protein
VIDFHCHLDLYPDPHAVCDECARREMYVLSVTTTPSAWYGTSALAKGKKRIRTALGLHPQLAHERQSELSLFDDLVMQTRYVGEIGLDGAPEFRAHWKDQIDVFEHILKTCSTAGGRIMSIHSRRAATPVLDKLEEYRLAGVPVLHWFSGTRRELERAIRIGCWFSIGPAMFSSENGRKLVALMPKERILTESDGPFAQLAGKAIKPWDVANATEALARIWSVPVDGVPDQLEDNLQRITTNQKSSSSLEV